MDIDLQAVLQSFLAESDEGLSAAEQALITLESCPQDEEALATIFRVAHTLKGNASSFGFQPTTELAHAVEDILDRLRKRERPVTSALVTLLLEAIDALREMVPAAAAGTEEMQPEQQALLARLVAAGAVEPAPAESAPAAAVDRRRSPGRRREDQERDTTLRVDLAKLDRMMDLTGEIAVARGRVQQLLAELGGQAGDVLRDAHREADRLSVDLQELVMKARMVPLGPVFRRHARTVRDLASAHGKDARLAIEGEDVEVDTSVVEHISDPLTHMIRNAIDHGIEPPDVRRRRGKDPCGTVTLRAFRDAGSIVIQVADDGVGLDRKRIVARARKLGTPDAETLSDQQLHRLVLEPGFSTAETVTDLSGRGIGLDVVRRNVERLRGAVEIESREGKGTTITLRLPLTLAIITGFAVGVGGETYLMPLDAVVECLELPREECPHADGRGVLNLRGEVLPYLRLGEVFGVDGAGGGQEHVVVVEHDGGKAGLVVHGLFGESQTVIKPLGRLFRDVPGIAGSAILGSGRVALILDVPALVRQASARRAEPVEEERSRC